MESRTIDAATKKMLAGVVVLAAVCAIGVAGYVVAGWSLQDSGFMVVITIFGVGYGEVRPVDTWPLRSLTGFVIVAGYGAVIYTVGGFIQLVVDGQLNRVFGARRMKKEIEAMSGHTIVCGFGRMGRSLAAEFAAAGQSFVAIDIGPDAVEHARLHDMPLIMGDASDEDILRSAGIDRAHSVAAVLSDDAINVFVTLTARAMNPDLLIIARGENRRTEQKLRVCGADSVVLPTDIGASRVSQLIVRPTAEQMFETINNSGDLDMISLGLEFDELRLPVDSPFIGRALGAIEVGGAYGYLIVAIRRVDGELIMHPDPDIVVLDGDRLIVLGYHDDLPRLDVRPSASTP